MQISDNLLQKYNVPVPRYTSYPPANHFSDDFNALDYSSLLTNSNMQQPSAISLYIHIPFCNKLCFYCGCNACNIGDGHLVKPYIEALKAEIAMVAAHIDKRREVTQIHYGGGTPNAIPVEYIEELNNFLFETFQFSQNPEIAIETHPAYLDESYIAALKNARFNRFSMGIQDFDADVLKIINREPAQLPISELMELLRGDSPDVAVNLDFIYGLPHQTPESFAQTLEQAVALQPDRLVTFSYAHVPWVKKQQKILEKAGLPDPQTKMAMFLNGYKLLTSKGYKPIGLDHFVKESDELYVAMQNGQLHRNFQGYATRHTTGQVYAFGASAISQTEKGYAQNEKDTQAYIDVINRGEFATVKGMHVTEEQTQIRHVITQIMCNKFFDWHQMATQLNTSEEALKELLNPDEKLFAMFEKDELIQSTDSGFIVTESGTLFMRNIAAAMDPAYKAQQNKYSQSV
ncbi:MAG: oxygen-independent coproporphyrinogen III oxidase [Salinivirgaceae bacterium]|jgi:oxygen-independent coproporphyrinogen-3 oxidase|nr:oxygen-independent coproporphyrinogen III oxidase [Salinivirgaceae bacterium]